MFYIEKKKKIDNTRNVAQVFAFANRYRGAYSSSLYHAVCPFYCDFNGYQVKKNKKQLTLYFTTLVISRWMMNTVI